MLAAISFDDLQYFLVEEYSSPSGELYTILCCTKSVRL